MKPDLSFKLARIEATVCRVPIATPVQTAFGIMRERPALFLKVFDENGHTGLGEIWCNFPNVGAEHRARLLLDSVAPLALATHWSAPAALQNALETQLHILGIQSGEPGPLAQTIAGLDIACWDLVACRANLPLWRLLGGTSPRVAVYASGLNPTAPEALARECANAGHDAFKLKVGFGLERDSDNLNALRQELGTDAELMVDANQAWTRDQALVHLQRWSGFGLRWVEEPLSADTPLTEWQALAKQVDTPIAAGENLRGHTAFTAFMGQGGIRVVQPDIAKWGGLSACLPLGRHVLEQGRRLCPHWLGGGIGLVASLHFKSALGGNGRVEIDANANPLREAFLDHLPVKEGSVTLTDAPGLGLSRHMERMTPLKTLSLHTQT